ncbi:MAG: DUF222 domain-containing protein [Actinomycetota bacterium]
MGTSSCEWEPVPAGSYAGLVDALMNLDDAALTDEFRSLELRRREVEARMAAIVRESERRSLPAEDGHRSVTAWVRAHTNCARTEAARLRRLAQAADSVPGLGDALFEGHIGGGQADELARARANPRCGDQLADSAEMLLDHAEHLSFEELRTVVKRWETLADLDGAQQDDDASHEARTASVGTMPDAAGAGVDIRASGGSGLVAAEFATIFTAFVEYEFQLDVAARTAEHGPDAPASLLPRTDAQRRYDALLRIFRRAAHAGVDGPATPLATVVNVLTDQHTLERVLALHGMCPPPDDLPTPDIAGQRIETSSGSVLAPDDVVLAALRGHVRRVVIDAASVPVDAGRKRRLFTGVARDLIKMMRPRCSHAGCTVPGEVCEVDHVAEWVDDHGLTDAANGRPRCGSHNRFKHQAKLKSHIDAQGRLVDYRPDGTPIAPAGRRIARSDTSGNGDEDADSDHGSADDAA